MKFLIAAMALSTVLAAAAAETPCEQSPLLAGKCFWVRGRLTAANGAPTFRIWPVGTWRMLGVNGPGGARDGDLETRPDSVLRVTPGGDGFHTAVYADYLLCPLTKSRQGRMPFVCIARAAHAVARPR